MHTHLSSTSFPACSRQPWPQQRNAYWQIYLPGCCRESGPWGFPVAPKRAARSISHDTRKAPSSLDGGPCSLSSCLSAIFQESVTSPRAPCTRLLYVSQWHLGPGGMVACFLRPRPLVVGVGRCALPLSIWEVTREKVVITHSFLRPLLLLCFPAAPTGTRLTQK